MASPARWEVVADESALAHRAAEFIAGCAREAIGARGVFRIVLAGGRTPAAAYRRLVPLATDWHKWQVYFGDERCLPAGHAGRNDTMARTSWLGRVAIPAGNVYSIPAELGPDRAAARYAGLLSALPEFDLVLLGLGEDGHTASLFPGHAIGDEPGAADVLAVHDAPKPPAERVSLSAARLRRAREVLFLVSGAAKRAAVAAWRSGAELPARHIASAAGARVLLDREADAAHA
jgi:6-phosphogluconolactonase